MQKFRFCGDLDCPDWILAEMHTLSKMSCIKMKILCQLVAKSLSGQPLEEEKARKMITDSNLEHDSMEACVSALNAIMYSTATFGVESDVLGYELEQLGLPKEHATALCKVYVEHQPAIYKHFSTGLRVNQLANIQLNPFVEMGNLMKLEIDLQGDCSYSIAASRDQLRELLSDLEQVKGLMDTHSGTSD